jgi:hypothetical protein
MTGELELNSPIYTYLKAGWRSFGKDFNTRKKLLLLTTAQTIPKRKPTSLYLKIQRRQYTKHLKIQRRQYYKQKKSI